MAAIAHSSQKSPAAVQGFQGFFGLLTYAGL